MDAELRTTTQALGTTVEILVGAPAASRPLSPEVAAEHVMGDLMEVQERLSRFDNESELSRLNIDPRERVSVSPLLAEFVAEADRARSSSDGLVDSALVDELERAGYCTSRVGLQPADLEEALAAAPARRPARPRLAWQWGLIAVDRQRRVVSRPPGLRFESGGIGKGLAADIAARRLETFTSFAVDCGGDVVLGGTAGLPRSIEVEHPLGTTPAASLDLRRGAVATSGLKSRIWRREDGRFAHHLIDPLSGEPAWTGLIQVTAIAERGVDAERLAKHALLAGAEQGRAVLAKLGGVLIHDDGTVEAVGSLAPISLAGVA